MHRSVRDLKKGLKTWRGGCRCWLTELPEEILVSVLMAVIETEKTPQMPTFWTLVTNFKEFGQLVLSVEDFALNKPILHRRGLLRVHIDQLPMLPIREVTKRPLRLRMLTKQSMCKSWLSLHLSDELNSISEVPSVWVSCALRAHCTSLNEYPGIQPEACKVVDKTQITVDYSALDKVPANEMSSVLQNGFQFILTRRIEKIYQGSCDLKLHWSPTPGASFHLYNKVLVKNCLNFKMRIPYNFIEVDVLSIDMIESQISPGKTPLVILPFIPNKELRISFSRIAVPELVESTKMHEIVTSSDFQIRRVLENTIFTLENKNWSYKNPYGHSTARYDQATLNYNNRRQRLKEDDQPIASIAYSNYSILKFYGVPDSTFLGMNLSLSWNVQCLYWWRLSPRRPSSTAVMDWPRILAPDMTKLHLISVVKADQPTPSFISPLLEKLVLISLDDSDSPWDLYHLLDRSAGSHQGLRSVYLEHRTQHYQKDSRRMIPLDWYDLGAISASVERLHVRGYVPVFVLPHQSVGCFGVGSVRFQRLTHLMLDISLVGHVHEWGKYSEVENLSAQSVTLGLRGYEYPRLKTISLMCSREASAAKALERVKLSLFVPQKCQEVIVSALVQTKSFWINGFEMPLEACRGRESKEPFVSSRRCFRWKRRLWMNSFYFHKKLFLKDDWLSEIREY